MRLNSIRCDDQGLYFSYSEISSLPIPNYQAWVCKECTHNNMTGKKTCSKCGASAPNYKK